MRLVIEELNTDVHVIPDLHHWHQNIRTIRSMINDNQQYCDKMLEIFKMSTNPTVIFAGDIYHREINGTDDGYKMSVFPRNVKQITKSRSFSVLGNHELSYRKNNVFWNIAEMKTDYISDRTRCADPLLYVTDELRVGRTLFIFGHSGIDFTSEIDTEGIDDVYLITHNAIMENQILQYFKDKGRNINETFIGGRSLFTKGVLPLTSKLRGVYVGHLHTAHGKFQIEENISGINFNFFIQYLGSVGRTSASEFTDDNAREIPVISVRDGRVIKVFDKTLNLIERKYAVKEDVVEENKVNYKKQVRNREIRNTSISFDDGLTPSVLNYFEEMNLPEFSTLKMAVDSKMPDDIAIILNEYGVL